MSVLKSKRGESKLAVITKAREKRKLRRQCERVKQGKMTKTEVYHSYQGFRNNALKGNNRNIITEMDKYFKSLWEE